MKHAKHTTKQIIRKLKTDELIAQDKTVEEVCRVIEMPQDFAQRDFRARNGAARLTRFCRIVSELQNGFSAEWRGSNAAHSAIATNLSTSRGIKLRHRLRKIAAGASGWPTPLATGGLVGEPQKGSKSVA
ncbi:hypothetical protein ACLM45_03330 [Synechococcus sp. A10-1-5-9]|uniref:hypothetical protein n=1 Tax=Synechococcus sp. A10-1-5-9 TaxID=3392295 RepID=UPI0039EAD986